MFKWDVKRKRYKKVIEDFAGEYYKNKRIIKYLEQF